MRWLVTGASGVLGSYLLRELRDRDAVFAWSGTTSGEQFGRTLRPVDLADADAVASGFEAARPDVVIHAGALARVDACFRDPERAERINAGATQQLAKLCDATGARLAYVSTDLVFDGERAPYRETDPTHAISTYGRSKAAGEHSVLAISRGVAAHVSLLYGSAINGRPGYFDNLVESLRTGQPMTLFADEWRTPLALSTAARALVALAESDVAGTVHIGGPERMSRLEMGQRLAARLGVFARLPHRRQPQSRDQGRTAAARRVARFVAVARAISVDRLAAFRGRMFMMDPVEMLRQAIEFHRAGQVAEAEQLYRSLLAIRADDTVAAANLAVIAARRGDAAEAERLYRSAIGYNPDFGEAHLNLANMYARLHRVDEAIASYRAALASSRPPPAARRNLWQVLFEHNRNAEAAEDIEQYTRSQVGDAEAWHLLGLARIRLGCSADAIVALQRTLGLNPRHALAHNSMGLALEASGDPDGAVEYLNTAIVIAPQRPEAFSNLGMIRLEQGQAAEAVQLFRQSLAIAPKQPLIHSNLLLALNYLPDLSPADIFVEHRTWAAAFADPIPPIGELHRPDPDGVLHIGYVSADFRHHPVAAYIEGVLASHDRTVVRTTCYASVAKPDLVTARLESLADGWHDITGLNDAAAAELIRSDRVDILVDLCGHTSRNRLGVVARRPAPIQATHFGYPNTTGLQAMTHRFTDAFTDPPGADDLYVEKLVRLPEIAWCFTPPKLAPTVGPLPADLAGSFTFGSLNNTAKLTDVVLDAWARILASTPQSRLILLGGASIAARRRLGEFFVQRGVGERLEVLPRLKPAEYYSAYNRIDLGLDPFPYNGGVTTCDSLWMGVPYVCLAGTTYAGRQGAAIATAVGLDQLVANTLDEYVTLAVRTANDPDWLRQTRQALRERFKSSRLFDAVWFTRNLEAAYREMARAIAT